MLSRAEKLFRHEKKRERIRKQRKLETADERKFRLEARARRELRQKEARERRKTTKVVGNIFGK